MSASIKDKMLEKASEKLTKDIDIRLILKRLQKVKKMEKILFNQNERKIFKFMPTKIIKVDVIHDHNEKSKTTIQPMNQPENSNKVAFKGSKMDTMKDFSLNFCNYENFFQNYEKVKYSTKDISLNIMNTLDPGIKEIFEILSEMYYEENCDIDNDTNEKVTMENRISLMVINSEFIHDKSKFDIEIPAIDSGRYHHKNEDTMFHFLKSYDNQNSIVNDGNKKELIEVEKNDENVIE